MEIRHITPSAQIYIDQINIYIETGEGYQQIRGHLLKELNSIDAENQYSDETLAPALIQNLRKKLMEDSSQQKSRTIDVIEDLITYADQVIQGYITSEFFCITLQTYKLFNPFSKGLFDENRLRLCSILLYYYEKFQSNPSRYGYVFKTYRQLKERNYTFPSRTYINRPKVNQFKVNKLNKKVSQKSADSDKVGVTFDSIIEFVNDCQRQFDMNKLSCANTQFVRALKVKAKTLFDLSQNTQGLDLNAKQKEHAKQLYKQIRTMLKQIQKLSEQKAKEQKIKNEKEFVQVKIEQMTPRKSEKELQSKRIQNVSNLLDDGSEELINTGNVVITPLGGQNVQTPKIKKSTSLLDDNEEEEFTEFVSQVKQLSIKKSTSSVQGPKPLKKPPKYDQTMAKQSTIQVTDTLIETVQTKTLSIKKSLSIQQPAQLIQTVTLQSVHSKKSLHSESSDKVVNLIEQPAKNDENILDFQNQTQISRFEVVNSLANKFIDPNAYNVIPHDVDFSDSSSQSGNRVTFQINKNQQFFDDDTPQPYDKVFLTPKKQSSQHQRVAVHMARSQQDLEKISSSANYQQQHQELIPNFNFGVLADMRQVKAQDYSQVQNIHLSRSISNVSEEERNITFTPQSIKNPRDQMSMKELSPGGMSFNQIKGKQNHQKLGQNQNDEQFKEYQEVEQTIEIKQIKKDTILQKLNIFSSNDRGNLLADRTPEKGTLMDDNESPISNKEPFL